MNDPSSTILLSRIQFALTLGFHILFPTLTIGLAGYIAAWEMAWLRTRDEIYYRLCRFWTKIFALGFGMGVVSGIVLSYEFGTNFSQFSERTGNILGPLMTYEVLTAFFLEAGFLGIMLFGWNKVSEKVHMLCTLLVTIGAIFSAFWILSANSWMQTPAGYRLQDGVFYVESWLKIVFNPSFPYRFAHMVTASYLATTFLIAGVAAWYLLRGKEVLVARKLFSQIFVVALVLAPLQLLLGDMHGLNTLHYQPIKIAAIESRWDTMRAAPLTLFALPDTINEKNDISIDLPHLGSLILTHEWNGEVVGLKSVAKEDRPYVPIPFFSFRIMVAIGLWFILLAVLALVLRMKKQLYSARWFQRCCFYSTPLGFVAVIAGWFTTETGRQPWIVYGILRTRDVASRLPAPAVATSLGLFVILYLSLLAAFVFYFIYLINHGFEQAPKGAPKHITVRLEKNHDA